MRACWLCGDIPQTSCAYSCSEKLAYSCESVIRFATKFEIGVRYGNDDVDVVCDACMGLLVKIDQSSYELDSHVANLKIRVGFRSGW